MMFFMFSCVHLWAYLSVGIGDHLFLCICSLWHIPVYCMVDLPLRNSLNHKKYHNCVIKLQIQ